MFGDIVAPLVIGAVLALVAMLVFLGGYLVAYANVVMRDILVDVDGADPAAAGTELTLSVVVPGRKLETVKARLVGRERVTTTVSSTSSRGGSSSTRESREHTLASIDVALKQGAAFTGRVAVPLDARSTLHLANHHVEWFLVVIPTVGFVEHELQREVVVRGTALGVQPLV